MIQFEWGRISIDPPSIKCYHWGRDVPVLIHHTLLHVGSSTGDLWCSSGETICMYSALPAVSSTNPSEEFPWGFPALPQWQNIMFLSNIFNWIGKRKHNFHLAECWKGKFSLSSIHFIFIFEWNIFFSLKMCQAWDNYSKSIINICSCSVCT